MSRDHFDLIAGFYDRGTQFTPSETLLGQLSLPTGGLLLDAGGGTGRVAAALLRSVGGAVVADLSRGMLRRAAGKGLVTVHAPAECLPFPAGTFDRIVMMDALHHVFDQQQTGDELWRVLCPGGRLVIVEPDIQKFSVKMIALGEKLLLMRSHFLSGRKIASLFAKQGGQVSVIQDRSNILILVEKGAQK
jgi:ubiquinone/menaquinone biosynthesis C-methylase UbiE